MSKMIQIRNVPDELHRKLKAKAALEGLPLSEYLLREIRPLADQPTVAEFLERVRRRLRMKRDISSAELIRDLRGPLRP